MSPLNELQSHEPEAQTQQKTLSNLSYDQTIILHRLLDRKEKKIKGYTGGRS